jgi:pSer/pThr/pTyr-binding forkhead associated (FHA) protein
MRLICTDKSLVDGPENLVEVGSYRVGRSSRCSFVVSDLSVSRVHAEVIVYHQKVRIRDLGSRNGTFVDGVQIKEAVVQPGQSVQFGSAQFHLVDDQLPDASVREISDISTHIVENKPIVVKPAALAQLSDAQRRVLDHLLTGLQEKEVACKLDISPNTVHSHVTVIYRTLEVSSRAELLALFITDQKKPEKPGKSP